MWNIIESIATGTESAICADFLVRFLQKKSSRNAIICFMLITLFNMLTTTVLNQFILFEGALGFIRVLINFTFAFFLMNGTIFEKIMSSLLSEIALLISNFTLVSVVSAVFDTPVTDLAQKRNIIRFLVLIISKFLLFILTRTLIKIKNKNSYMLSFAEWIVMSVIFAITMFLEMELAKFSIDNNSDDKFIIISAVCLIIINILIYVIMIQMSRKNAENTILLIDKMQLWSYKNQFAEIQKKYDELRKLRHDMKNHLQCILMLIDDNDSKQAKEYISDIIGTKLEFTFEYLNTGNKIVDAVANTKLAQCKNEDIETIIRTSDFSLDIDETDICIILSNLFDNAIEACRKSDSNRLIYFEISKKKSYVNIIIKNKINNSVLQTNPQMTTTKENKNFHGIGIKSIKNIINKYDGMIDFYEENNCFCVDVWIPEVNK